VRPHTPIRVFETRAPVARRDILYIAARAPRPGFAKSRLGRIIGHQRAADLYAAFLQDLAARFARVPFAVGWYVTPEDAWPELRPLLGPVAWSGPAIVQGPGDWTTRQRELFLGAGARGEQRTVLAASDSPHLTVETVAEAFDRLDHDDLVLGPTADGGYYLIGMRAPHEVLAGVRMSTGTVLEEIVARAEALGLATGLLPPTFDVDEAADLDRLIPLALERNDLAWTRAALDHLRLLPTAPVAAVGGRR